MRTLAAILTDAVLVIYAYVGATLLRTALGGPPEMLDTLLFTLGPMTLLHILALALMDAYDFAKTRGESDLAFSAIFGTVIGAAVSFLGVMAGIVYYAPDAQPIGRSVFLGATALCLILLPGWRVWHTKQRRRRGELRTRVLLVGRLEAGQPIAREIEEYSRGDHEIVGAVTAEAAPDAANSGYLGAAEDLPRIAAEHGAEEALIIGEQLSRDPARLLRVIELCEEAGLRVHILPGLYEAMVGRLDLHEVGGVPLIELRTNPIHGSNAALKRLLDIVCAAAGLVLAAPILLLAALAIKLTSPGPVFYKQTRCGLKGKEFTLIKLRTMRVDAEKECGPVWASKNDPRVTPVGEFLRRKRIDEIPQLWNVLKGEMSMVGPRPERPFFVEEFRKEIPLFPLRLWVKPGVTSLSHVWGRYDSTPADRLRYDLVYMSNASFWLDLRILLETVKVVITGRGAQ